MHDAAEPKSTPRAGAKKQAPPSDAALDMQRRIEVACAGQRCWRCFRVECGCEPGFGFNGGAAGKM